MYTHIAYHKLFFFSFTHLYTELNGFDIQSHIGMKRTSAERRNIHKFDSERCFSNGWLFGQLGKGAGPPLINHRNG